MSNILPKKSWHVGKSENIEKVAKDEASAQMEESRKKAERDLKEREAKYDILCRRSGISADSFEKRKLNETSAISSEPIKIKESCWSSTMNKSPFETTKRWYETSKNDKNYSESSRRRDEERKDKEDPMNLFKRR